MSLERRTSQLRRENKDNESVYSLVEGALKKDLRALFAHLKQRAGTQSFDEELAEVYELRPDNVPNLSLFNNLQELTPKSSCCRTTIRT